MYLSPWCGIVDDTQYRYISIDNIDDLSCARDTSCNGRVVLKKYR